MLKQLTPREILLLIANGTHVGLLNGEIISGKTLAELYLKGYRFYETDPKRMLYRAIKWS